MQPARGARLGAGAQRSQGPLAWILDQAGETGMGKRLERKGPLVSGAPENATQALEHKGP